jgi:hypothetical protein
MYALSRTADSYTLRGDYDAAYSQFDELIPLAVQRGKALMARAPRQLVMWCRCGEATLRRSIAQLIRDLGSSKQ